jgi:hypothetical protein
MFKRIVTLLRRIGRRIDKVELVRDLLLVVFLATFGYFYPAISDLIRLWDSPSFNKVVLDNPMLYLVILMPFGILGLMLLFIHKIDAWVDVKAERRHQELLKAIRSIGGCRYGRDEHPGK